MTTAPNVDQVMLTKGVYERKEHDAYWTPEWVTAALLNQLILREPIHEPACGQGHIVRVLDQYGYKGTVATDLVDHGFGIAPVDFLQSDGPHSFRTTITNPPYICAEQFIWHALQRMSGVEGGMVVMLLRNEYDCAKMRRPLFEHPHFARKFVLTKRPTWFGDHGNPRHNFAWYVWDTKHQGPPTIGYLP